MSVKKEWVERMTWPCNQPCGSAYGKVCAGCLARSWLLLHGIVEEMATMANKGTECIHGMPFEPETGCKCLPCRARSATMPKEGGKK